jgi:Na+/proline symporter
MYTMMPLPPAHKFTGLDWFVLVAYLVGITLFGLWISRKLRNSRGYFLGERKLPWWVMVGQSFGTGTHAESPVAQAGASCSLGLATIWYQWKNMLITPFYWLMAPWYRRAGRTTIGEIIADRYSRGLALFYTLFAVSFFVFNQGAMLKGAGKIISIATGGGISPNGVILAMTVTFILYSLFGGLIASAYTDFVQGFLIITLSFMLIPMGLREVGGFAGMHQSLPPHFFDLVGAVSGLDWFTIAMLALNGLIGITAMPHTLSMNATGRTERAGRVGQTYGSMVKRFCTIGWALTGLIVAAMILKRGVTLPDAELAFGYASRELLGSGLTGLLVACVLAANTSACSNFMVNTGALFTFNIYQQFIDPQADDRRLLWVGRLSGLTLTVLGVLFGLFVREVLQAFLFTETIAALMGIMFFGGFLWRRANRHGALASALVAFAVYYGLNYAAAGTLKLVYKWQPGTFGWAMLAGFASLIVVSLLTQPEDPRRIKQFFDNQRRSTDCEASPENSAKPLAADRGQELLLLDAAGWFRRDRWTSFTHRYREDLVGLVLAYASVAALVGLAWVLMQIGK